MQGRKLKYIAILIPCIILVALWGLSNWSYPQGESYQTGKWITRGDAAGTEVPEVATAPSPISNPLWVRIFQDYSAIGIISFIVGVLALGKLTSKEGIERVGP